MGKHAKRTTVRKVEHGAWRVDFATYDRAASVIMWPTPWSAPPFGRAIAQAHRFEWVKANAARPFGLLSRRPMDRVG